MSGGSLRQYINKVGALDEELSKRYMRQIVLAVTYLHDECDIVHRDIKAGNVLLNVNCTEIKLCDFGVPSVFGGISLQDLTEALQDPHCGWRLKS